MARSTRTSSDPVVRTGQEDEPRQERGRGNDGPQHRQRSRCLLQQFLVPLDASAREDPPEDSAGDGAEHAANRKGEQGQDRKAHPLPQQEPGRAAPLQALRHPIAHPSIRQRIVPIRNPRHGLRRKSPEPAVRVAGAHEEHGVASAAAVWNVSQAIDTGREPVARIAVRIRRSGVAIDLEMPFQHGAELPGEIGPPRQFAGRKRQIPGRPCVVALSRRQIGERAERCTGRVRGLDLDRSGRRVLC